MNSITINISREIIPDDDADLSWLEQSDEQMGEGFEASAKERLEAYRRGDWHMVGVRAKADIAITRNGVTVRHELTSPGLWGIESDSGEEYLESVFQEEKAALGADLEAIRGAYAT